MNESLNDEAPLTPYENSTTMAEEILEYDLLINTALMKDKVAPWLTDEIIDDEERNLTAISDVSCDPTGPCNHLPIYSEGTTMDKPVTILREDELLEITAIDHLPSLLPRESSDDFCQQLLPHLISFLNGEIVNSPWERSLEIFFRKTEELKLGEIKSVRKVEDSSLLLN